MNFKERHAGNGTSCSGADGYLPNTPKGGKNMGRSIKTGAVLLALVLAVSLLCPMWVSAAYSGAGDGDITVTVKYHPGNTDPTMSDGEEGIRTEGYRLYHIADMNAEQTGFVLRPGYEELLGTSIVTTFTPYNVYEQATGEMVQRIGAYINQRDTDVEPDYAAPIVKGEAVFTNLPEGLYLGVGPQTVLRGTTYTPQPFLISLPYMVAEGQEVLPETDMEKGVTYKELTVSVKFTEDTPEEGGKPTPEPSVTPESVEPDEKLPQTGLLWWPVPVLVICGLVLVLLGVHGRRKSK